MGEEQETAAFLSWLSTFQLSKPVTTLADLSDGIALFDVLSTIDPDYFRHPSRPADQVPDNWPLRFTVLKRLFRLVNQYFSDVLRQPTSAIDVPDLQAIAKDYDAKQTLILCRLTIAIAVQSSQNQVVIGGIQQLSEKDQHALMRAIEQVMSKLGSGNQSSEGMTDDDHYYEIQMERRRILAEKETLEKVYQSLLEEHRTLQTNYDDATAEKEDAIARLQSLRSEVDDKRNDKADMMLRAEIDRLRADLQKSEDNLNVAEIELDKQQNLVNDLTKKVEDLQLKAEEAARLKDQVDEYRHAADKLQKTENVMEKYKKKLEESADLRRNVKALEEQNAKLVDKTAALEEEYKKVAAFKPLMTSYKNQLAEMESKNSARAKEIEGLKYELEQTKVRLKIAAEERAKDSEALELYQERVRELELGAAPRPRAQKQDSTTSNKYNAVLEGTLGGEILSTQDDDHDPNDTTATGLGGELDDAVTGTTTTDLKLQIRKLKRELEDAKTNQADASKILVLENLLEDANRMKTRYETDYLTAHREKLILQTELEEIRSGKALGDGPEAAIALRQRLNETVDALDALRKEHTEMEVKFDSLTRELTITKSDLNLVNKDQLDILNSLRESVNEDKVELESEVERLRGQIRDLNDKNRMQLEQVNALLMEKVTMQSEGLGHRERMIEREREFLDLKSVLAGKDLPEEIKSKLLSLHEENVTLKEQVKTLQEKLLRAKQFIKEQDKLFRDEAAKSGTGPPSEEAQTQLKILEEDISRLQREILEARQRYQKEQDLMLGYIHSQAMTIARLHQGSTQAPLRTGALSWMGQQRKSQNQILRR